MSKAILLLLGILVATIVGYTLLGISSKKNKGQIVPTQGPITVTPVNVDFTAGFAIFTNGTFRVFTASMYHNLSKDVFIQTDDPNIVRVKKSGVTWDDFFKTLPFKLTKDCLTTGTKQTFCTNDNGKLRFYLNGKEDTSALDKQIARGDKLLVSYGNESEEQIQKRKAELTQGDAETSSA